MAAGQNIAFPAPWGEEVAASSWLRGSGVVLTYRDLFAPGVEGAGKVNLTAQLGPLAVARDGEKRDGERQGRARAGARWKRQQRENNLRLLNWVRGSSGTRETPAWWQTASELGVCRETRRRERRWPAKVTAGQTKGPSQSQSVTAASRASVHPSVRPGQPKGSSGGEGAQRNAAREGRLAGGD